MENKENITVIGTVLLKDIEVAYNRPTIRDQRTGRKYDLPINCGRFDGKRVCIEGYVMQTKQVGDKTYYKLWVDSIVEVA